MIVYHGTTDIIKKPDISFSKNNLDFGRGFYLTTYKEQAQKWAVRKASRSRKKAIVNIYELNINEKEYNVLKFKNADEEWLEFICKCRSGENVYNDYDIIMGNVADDDVFKTVDMYFKGLWDRERTIKELRYYKINDQICIVKQDVLNRALSFKDAYEVE